MDHRRLRERGQQFVGGMRGEDDRILLTRLALGHAVVVLVERMERGIGVPGFVEMQEVDRAADLVGDLLGVVAQAVVGRVGHHRDARLGAGLVGLAGQRIGGDALLQRFRRELVQADRADDAVCIAAGREVHRHRAGHDQRMQKRLVAVPVDEHHVAAGHGAMPHDLVGRRRTVGDEEGVVGAEVARGLVLGLLDRAGVVQQRAQLRHRNRQIAAQRVLTIELVEGTPDRRLGEGHAAGMARRMPGIVRLGSVMDQRLEERRQQVLHVVFGCTHHLPRNEALGVFEQEDEAVDVLEQLARHLLDGAPLAVQEHRQVGAARTLFAQEGGQALELAIDLLAAVDRDQHRRSGHVGTGTGTGIVQVQAAQHALVIAAQLFHQRTDEDAADARRVVVTVDDDDRIIQGLEIHVDSPCLTQERWAPDEIAAASRERCRCWRRSSLKKG
ncbi:hypothetical protein D3C71_689710 [compost metagenome]